MSTATADRVIEQAEAPPLPVAPRYKHMVVAGRVVSILIDELHYTQDGTILAVSKS